MRSRWLGPGAIKLHVAVLVVVGGCLAAFWWQLGRALHGHSRSWAYAVEWPLFAAYAVWMWWKLLHEEPGFSGAGADQASTPSPDPSGGEGDEEDEEHRAWVAYNEYLARLSAANRQRRP